MHSASARGQICDRKLAKVVLVRFSECVIPNVRTGTGREGGS